MTRLPRAAVHRLLCFAISVALAAAAPPAGAQLMRGEPPGVQQTRKLVDRAEALIEQINDLQRQMRITLNSYNSLIAGGGGGDLRPLYKELDKGLRRCDKLREKVRERAETARMEADKYFLSWAQSLPAIESEELRSRSQQRLDATKARFQEILAEGSRAGDAYEPFIGEMRDHWAYLEHDLNRSGLDSLSNDAHALNDRAVAVLLEIDGVLRELSSYVAELRTEVPPPPPVPGKPAAE